MRRSILFWTRTYAAPLTGRGFPVTWVHFVCVGLALFGWAGGVLAEDTNSPSAAPVIQKISDVAASTNAASASATISTNVSPKTTASTAESTTDGKNSSISKNMGVSYESFKIVQERNIFDPKRMSRAARASARGSAAEAKKAAKVDTFSLVGILNSASGDFAFFEGSSSEFKKVARPKDSFAGFRVTEVTPNQVSLIVEGKTNRLSVGSRMKRQDDGPWEMASAGETIAAASSDSSSTSEDKGSSGGESGESDILKRLRLKREREMKNEK